MLKKNEMKYNNMLEKAEEQFAQYGYKAVSMDQIAEAAGVSKMTLYKYFESKENLFAIVMNRLTERTYDDLLEKIDAEEGTLNKIDTLFKGSIENSRHYSLALYRDILGNQRVLEMMMAEKKKMMQALFANILTLGIEKKDIREIDVTFVANLFNAMLEGLAGDYNEICSSKETLEGFAEKLWDFLKYGLLGDKEVE